MDLEREFQILQTNLYRTEFSRKDAQKFLGLGEKATRKRIQAWIAQGKLHKIGTGRAANVRYSFQSTIGDNDSDLSKAQGHFANQSFTRKELESVLNLKTSTVRKRLNGWLENPKSRLIRIGSGSSPNVHYKFVESG